MCGIFGFISKRDDKFAVDIPTLENLGLDAQTRGEDACGVAWIDAKGRLRHAKRTGKLEDNLDLLQSLDGARVVIGHTRMATHGSAKMAANNHPHLLDNGNGFLVHNGVFLNHLQMLHIARRRAIGDCDTEGLCLLASSTAAKRAVGKCRVKRLVWALQRATHSGAAIAALWRDGLTFLVKTSGRPICISETKAGYWFCSLPDSLPGKVSHFLDGMFIEFVRQNGAAKMNLGKAKFPDMIASRSYSWASGSVGNLIVTARPQRTTFNPMPSSAYTPRTNEFENYEAEYQRQLWLESVEWRKS